MPAPLRTARGIPVPLLGFHDDGMLSSRSWVTEFIGHVLRRDLSDAALSELVASDVIA